MFQSNLNLGRMMITSRSLLGGASVAVAACFSLASLPAQAFPGSVESSQPQGMSLQLFSIKGGTVTPLPAAAAAVAAYQAAAVAPVASVVSPAPALLSQATPPAKAGGFPVWAGVLIGVAVVGGIIAIAASGGGGGGGGGSSQ